MNDEMILVPRAELLAWAKAWLYEYGPNDGTDCVTPFDTYLLKSPVETQPCGCGEATCTAPWEPGCGLGKSDQHAEALQAENETLRDALDYLRQMQGAKAAPAEAEVERLRAEREVIGAEAVKYAEKSGRLEAKAYLLAEALRGLVSAVDDLTAYTDGEDEIGYRPCCGVLSHKPHEDDCAVTKARSALRDHDGGTE